MTGNQEVPRENHLTLMAADKPLGVKPNLKSQPLTSSLPLQMSWPARHSVRYILENLFKNKFLEIKRNTSTSSSTRESDF